MSTSTASMTPREIVQELDRFIVGQQAAKRACAIALRNRWRRMQVSEDLRQEITPKNILMIGPTGVGKTEIARRLAKLADAPFTKVEATKFTEVGYVGRDVDSIIKELMDAGMKKTREQEMEKVRFRAEQAAEDRILDVLLPPDKNTAGEQTHATPESETRQIFRKRLRSGAMDDKEIEIDLKAQLAGVEIMAPPGMEEMTQQLQSLFQNIGGGGKKKRRKMTIAMARKYIVEEEASKLIDEEDIKNRALFNVEQNGIVFLDEIDKITSRGDRGGADVSREGVQRDLLPLIEGTSVNTKYGTVRTDHILFIASGAFQLTKPSDLIPELQGRLPIRVELEPLTVEDFCRILTEPNAALTKQYVALLQTEGVAVTFAEDGVREIAETACFINEHMENIGARRLHTVMERLFEGISFAAADKTGQAITINSPYVKENLGNLKMKQDLSQYIL